MAYRGKRAKDLSIIRYRGLGTSADKERISTISAIIRNQAVSRKKGALLFRLVNHFRPAVTVELGTNLGVGTVFLALAYPRGRLYSIEGSRELLARARQYIDPEKYSNIRLLEGDFHDQLPRILQETANIDFAFMDGDHREQATVDYFELFCSRANNNTVLVVDDIHWSPGMERAWNTMIRDPRVTLAIDFYHCGILFFRRELSKQFFCLRF